MAVAAGYEPKSYISDGSLTPRGIEWPIASAAELIVEVDGEARTLNLHYEVTGVFPAAQIVPLAGFAANGQKVSYRRATQARQDYNPTGSGLQKVPLVGAIDRAAMVQQEQAEQLGRAVVVPVGDTPLVLEGVGEGQVPVRVGDRLIGAPNAAGDFAVEAEAAKAEVGALVEQAGALSVEIAEQAEQVASNASISTGAAAQAQNAALTTASTLAIAQALALDGRFYKAPTLAAAIAAAIADVADGQTFGASGDDVPYWELRERAGSGSSLFWPMPKAMLPGSEIRKITYDRALTLADVAVAADPPPIKVQFDVPAGMWGSIIVPSNSVTPFPPGTILPMLHMNTNPVRLVSDGVDGDVNIRPLIPGMTALVDMGARAWLMKEDTGPNDWLWFGELAPPPASAYSVKVFLDASAADTRKQERTGAAATTPAGHGQNTGSWRNLGTHGDFAKARADVRRPLVDVQTDGRVAIVTDGNATAANADFLELAGLTVNLERLNLFVAFKARAYGYAAGIISLAPFDTSGDLGNDRFAIAQNALNPIPSDYTIQMGIAPNRLAAGVAGVQPERPHVFEWRSTANNVPKTINIDGMEITHLGATGLAALANNTALTEATVRLIIGANPGNEGQGGAIQYSNTSYYGIVLHDGEPLTLAQRQAIRTYLEVKTHNPDPEYPSWSNLTEMEAARTTLQNEVFGGALPTDVATKTIDATPPVTGLTGLAAVYKLTIPGETDPLVKPRLWVPTFIRPGVTAQIWAGHSAGWNANGIRDHALQRYLSAGVPVITHVLPDGPNDFTSGSPTGHAANQTAYAKWARQAIVAGNTLRADYPGSEQHMCGISGGGWATVLCAALDQRIKKSVHFVGSIYGKHYVNVDFEQWLTQISLDELGLYILGAANGRVQRDVKRNDDDAGFDRRAYDSRAPYAEGVAARAAALGGGSYQMIWEPGNLHTLTTSSGDMLESLLP